MAVRQTKGATATQAIMDVKTRIAGALSVKTKHHVSPETMTVDQLIRAASKAGLKLVVSIEVGEMNDRELLEPAAKAAGYDVSVAKGGGAWINDGSRVWPKWNPLTEDADAFRIAACLGFSVDFGAGIIVYSEDVGDELEFENPSDVSNVRRAITRAAAEIGRAMP